MAKPTPHELYASYVLEQCRLKFAAGDDVAARRLHEHLERIEEMTDDEFNSPLVHSVAPMLVATP